MADQTPQCTGNPTSCSFCNPTHERDSCAKDEIAGCTSAPGDCQACSEGRGCLKGCAGSPENCTVCRDRCLKPASTTTGASNTASFGVEPARPK